MHILLTTLINLLPISTFSQIEKCTIHLESLNLTKDKILENFINDTAQFSVLHAQNIYSQSREKIIGKHFIISVKGEVLDTPFCFLSRYLFTELHYITNRSGKILAVYAIDDQVRVDDDFIDIDNKIPRSRMTSVGYKEETYRYNNHSFTYNLSLSYPLIIVFRNHIDSEIKEWLEQLKTEPEIQVD